MLTRKLCPQCGALMRWNDYFGKLICMTCGHTEAAVNYVADTGTQPCDNGGVSFRPDGVHELDPCVYETMEVHRNVTVVVSRCLRCGKVDIGWLRQPDTEDLAPEEWEVSQ